MMPGAEKDRLWPFALSLLILPVSVFVLLPLAAYALLAFASVASDGRTPSIFDWYRFVWSVTAVVLAVLHIVQSIRNFRTPSIKRGVSMGVCSALIALTCPVFWG